MSEKIEQLTEMVYEQDYGSLKEEIKNTNINLFNEGGQTLLHIASSIENSSEIIRILVNGGINVNTLDKDGCTSLLEAVKYDCPNNLKVLFDLGADPRIPNSEKQSPLQIACAGDNLECVQTLIENGVSVNDDSETNKTPLHYAVYSRSSIDLIEYLLDNRADINGGDGYGTPLMSAISREDTEMVKYLIGKGAKVDGPKNLNGESTIEFAKRVGNAQIVKYLEKIEKSI
ncbi:ankyrin repeat domain-containing protein [Aquimarina sp. MMG016]|uniref:ankyrin repeat domain-containing protein n=1 Tax=Aquimarina sp. MMG016 TaxID=2822690 RepID=UPI001B39EA1B|nr:ankyrin repeat domain-containing protein [Aquimarina sp. MMG016]MBQ4821873.1 ankyrin repeat domain-containing protein [Aquimarina sp. MMG016]